MLGIIFRCYYVYYVYLYVPDKQHIYTMLGETDAYLTKYSARKNLFSHFQCQTEFVFQKSDG